MKDEDVSEEGRPSTSLTLLQSARKGDQSAWGRIVAIYRPLMHGWLWFLQESDRDDIVQETFLAAWKGLGKFKRKKNGSFRAWLGELTANKTKDSWRKLRSRTGLPLPENVPDHPLQELSDERQIAFEEVVKLVRSRLKSETRQTIFSLRYLEQAPIEEIVARLGVTRGYVDVALAQIRSMVRRDYGDVLPEEWLQ